LRKHDLLQQVTHIASVSGGSILAAHLVLNWTRYLSHQDCVEAEQELIALGQRDIRGRIVRRWLLSILLPIIRLFPKHSHRTVLLEREYAKFLKGALVRDIDTNANSRPTLHLLATSFTTGKLCSFSSEGFWSYDDDFKPRLHRNDLIPLALAVASSSAFPPFFPPTAITRRMLAATIEQLPYDPEFLTDGGVFDNLGFAKFFHQHQLGNFKIDCLIVSDAGARLDWDIKGRFARVISRTIRSTDILMQRVADFTILQLPSLGATPFHLSIAQEILPNDNRNLLPVNFQKKLPYVRTDLNRFSPLEIDFLAKHGEAVAHSNLMPIVTKAAQKTENTAAHSETSNLSMPKQARLLDRARLRRLGLFDLRDWLSFALTAYVILIFVAMALPYVYVAQQAVGGNLFMKSVEVSFATDRKPESLTEFSDDVEDTLYTGLATVSVPANHQIGLLEQPGGGFFDTRSDPSKYFMLKAVYTALKPTPIAAPDLSNVLIYIHGFRTAFGYSLMKSAQLYSDTQFDGLAIGYSWGSHAKASAYEADLRAAHASVPHFSDYVSLLKKASIGQIDIVADDMGGIVLLEGIKRFLDSNPQLATAAPKKTFGQLVFFVPDIEVQHFASLLRAVSTAAERTTVFVAPHSEIMETANSQKVMQRAGSNADQSFLSIPNVDVILLDDFTREVTPRVVGAFAAILQGTTMPWNSTLRRRVGNLWDMKAVAPTNNLIPRSRRELTP